GAGPGRQSGAEEERSTIARNISGGYAAVCHSAGRRGADHRRAHVLPGIKPGTDSGTPAVADRQGLLTQFIPHQDEANGPTWLKKRVSGTRRSWPRQRWTAFASSIRAGWSRTR